MRTASLTASSTASASGVRSRCRFIAAAIVGRRAWQCGVGEVICYFDAARQVLNPGVVTYLFIELPHGQLSQIVHFELLSDHQNSYMLILRG